MIIEASVTINGSKASVWGAITNIEHAAEILSSVERIEMVEKPTNGLVGLRWRETRMLFGKPTTVDKWITEAKENGFYTTQAEDGGFVFLTTMRISESGGSVTLASTHETIPQGFVASLKALPMVFFKGMIKKAILQDLNDIKAAVERGMSDLGKPMRLRIDYFDQNSAFEKLLPQSGIVERTVPAIDSTLTWHLLRLDEPLHYQGTTIDLFMVASRWQDQSVGEAAPTSVFVLVVPTGTEVGQSFSTTQYEHVAWGMAHAIGA